MGTLVMVGIAALISVPFGILAAVFLAEFGPESKTASAVRFCARHSPAFPLFSPGCLLCDRGVAHRHLFGPGRGIALSLLMVLTVLLTWRQP